MYSADVIKVEHPVRGDDTRAWGPPYAKYEDASKKGPGESAYYLAVCFSSTTIKHIVLTKSSGQPKQEITRSILPTQVRCRDSTQARKGMRCPSRELSPRQP